MAEVRVDQVALHEVRIDRIVLQDIPEIARRLDVADKTVRRLIASGKLKAYRVGR